MMVPACTPFMCAYTLLNMGASALPNGITSHSLYHSPHRYPSHALLLWPSSQPNCVAKSRGMVGNGRKSGEDISRPTLPPTLTPGALVPSWVGSRSLTPTRPESGIHTAGIWPFSICTRVSPTQPLFPALLRRSQVRCPLCVMNRGKGSLWVHI